MTKTIAVFGAAGRTGRIFVQSALNAGYHVRAAIHKSPLPAHERLTVIRSDLTDRHDIANVLTGCDTVVSLLGHGRGSPVALQTDAMTIIAEEMEKHGIRRILSLTGTGVRVSGDHITLIDRLANAAISLVDPKRVADGINHVKVLQRSELDWTVVRVLKLTNGGLQPVLLTHSGPVKSFVSRQTVASVLLLELTQNKFVRELPIISSKDA